MSDSRTSNRDVGRSAAAIYSVGRGMSLRLYWLAMLGVLSLYIGIWLFNFENVYGMVVDDAMHFNMATWASKDWRVIFGVEHLSCYYFHFLFLEVPILSLPFSLPSYNIPFADGVTDKFRFFLLAATLLHIPVALAVGWFAERLVIQRWIALAGMILFVLSPTFVFWTPHPDGRLFELPPFLGMIGLLIYLNDRYLSATRRYRLQFIAGSLLFITLALNYNALFYGACFLVMWWGLALVRFWRRPRFWIEGCCFGAGFVLWFTLGELVGHYGAHTAWSQGHLATLLGQVSSYQTKVGFIGQLSQWLDIFKSTIGLPLVLLSVVGAVVWFRERRVSLLSPASRLILLGSLGLTVLYFLTKSTFPTFRQTVGFLPILMVLAALGAASLGAWAGAGIARVLPRVRAGGAITAGILVLAALPSLQESARVFESELGLGKIWRYAWQHGDGQQPWRLHFVWEDSLNKFRLLSTVDDVLAGDPETQVVSWFPSDFLLGQEAPWLLPLLERVKPLMAAPTPFGTATWNAETHGANPRLDLPNLPVLTEARLFRLGDLQREIRGEAPLMVAAVSADSVDGAHEPGNVFDRDASPDGITTWKSANTDGPHFLKIDFAKPVVIGTLAVVPAIDAPVVALEVQAEAGDGQWQTIWSGDHLESKLSLDVSFAPRPISHLKLIFSTPRRAGLTPQPPRYAEIDEVVFPGFSVVTPPPLRSFPKPVLETIRSLGYDHYRLDGEGITSKTQVMVDGHRVPTNFTPRQNLFGSLEIYLPVAAWTDARPLNIWLEGGVERSKTLYLAPP